MTKKKTDDRYCEFQDCCLKLFVFLTKIFKKIFIIEYLSSLGTFNSVICDLF